MKSRRRRGGSPFPANYFNEQAKMPSGQVGSYTTGYSNNVVRPVLSNTLFAGGKRKRKKGGFIPSVMEGFSILASKYITPLALFSGYKLIKKRTKTRKNRASRI
jgi:hypothetical protein